jgi:hypothetical protein
MTGTRLMLMPLIFFDALLCGIFKPYHLNTHIHLDILICLNSTTPPQPSFDSHRIRRIAETAKRYTKDHEYVILDDATNIGTVGITDYAQQALGDVVFVELPGVDTEVAAEGESSIYYCSQFMQNLSELQRMAASVQTLSVPSSRSRPPRTFTLLSAVSSPRSMRP